MRRLALTLVPLFLLACDREPVAPPIDDGPSFNWMNNPDNGNLRIFRYEGYFAASWTDYKTGLRATHTNFPIGIEPDCGPQVDLDPIDAQDVGLPDFNDFLASWFHTNAKGEVWLIVRDVTQAGDCYGNALVGQGTATFHYTDNDVLAWYPVLADPPGEALRQNNNAYGYMAEGTLTTVSGTEMRYSGHWRAVWDPQTLRKGNATTQVNLH